MKNIKKMTYCGLLIALSIVIPLTFVFLRVQAGPFSATLASHVPLFIAMFLGPVAAAMVGLGSALGFLMSAPAVIAARAFMHTFVGLVGAILIKKGVSFSKVIAITAPIHAILEALSVIPFGFTMYKVLVVVGVGTFLHHMVDGVIAFVLIRALAKSLKMDITKAAA
ncbi:ECF transporter S component [Clostridium magnum]|uniref:Niacin transporter NiaX n=1 Tax=Clostridium magnum DSM 2767 TaxID=1121326 RepID=A0A161WQB1_9CLOT|nr:ECF transporter S component [Clostridium magnum]KZL88818.1 niacin transporter NiaX [Clostridium magnum DSM 2767]SHI77648.1 niacin transporter [Clostridium magnum DSM 2767]